MPQPIVKYWDLTNPSDGSFTLGDGLLANFQQAGGPVGTEVKDDASYPLKFGDIEAGNWSVAQPIIVELLSQDTGNFDRPPAKNVKFKVYDKWDSEPSPTTVVTSLGDTIKGGANDWGMKYALSTVWIDPANVSAVGVENGSYINPNSTGTCTQWASLQWQNQAGSEFDLDVVGKTMNNGQQAAWNAANTLVKQTLVRCSASQSARWFTNFFIYIAIKPYTGAAAGTHSKWGFRLNYKFPGDFYVG